MNGEKVSRKEKNQNIQVFVRLRPINNRERELKSLGVVEVSGNREVIVKQSPLETKLSKKFTFDRAFGPNSKQVDVYHEVVSPLIEEVLAGYNCTVFAYGQTGTGKTHTMVGESAVDGDVPWQNDPMAGIIPRSLSQLFDELRITNSEYTVRVSYLELYNEELFDLLSSTEDNSKLRIYEDVTRKGSNIVNGLEEVTVYNKNEVYKIMAKGQEKRRIASTLMNAQSSRSHTVFTIVVHMKENSSDGEELMKIGKLNLVDLAGSENISKAGSDNPARKERARECVNINQSLLTLGRVITSLVERHPHIPYRESKLTRLLQESLGGRTKTSIIATISPGHRDVEETLSTLEYANRARCIQNKPEVNQRITKHAVLKEYSEEIDRLKRDLLASREKNGVYISMDSYSDMNTKMEEQSKELQEQILYIRAMKEEKDRIEGLFQEMADNLKLRDEQLKRTNSALANTKLVLIDTKKELVGSRNECDEQKHLVGKHVETEVTLSEQARSLLGVADTSTTDVAHLHNTVDKKKLLENTNLKRVKGFGEKSAGQRTNMKTYLSSITDSQIRDLQALQNVIDAQHDEHLKRELTTKELLSTLSLNIGLVLQQSEGWREEAGSELSSHCFLRVGEVRRAAEEAREGGAGRLAALGGLVRQLEEARQKDKEAAHKMTLFVQQWKDAFVAKLANVRHVQTEWYEEASAHLQTVEAMTKAQHEAAQDEAKRHAECRKQQQEEMNKEMQQLRLCMEALQERMSSSQAAREGEDRERGTREGQARGALEGALGAAREGATRAAGNAAGALGALDRAHQVFVRDMDTFAADEVLRVDGAEQIGGQIKESVSEISSCWQEGWNSNLTNIENVSVDIQKKQSEVISKHHQSYTDFSERCKSETSAILVSVESTISTLPQQAEALRTSLCSLHKSSEVFKEEMMKQICTNDALENKFLSEDYRLYSPTGKTPVRREFSYPRDLVSTSPHDRIIRRFRNMRNGIHSPQGVQVINLDQTIDETPVKERMDNSRESSDSGTASPAETFAMPPPPHTLAAAPSQGLLKSTSEGDIFSLVGTDSQSKENLNRSDNDKKEFKSRLRQPTSQKKVLGNRNY